MTKKKYKIQSQKSYWFEVLSLFTDNCLTKKEAEDYKHELSQRLADLVKNNCVLDDVNGCQHRIIEKRADGEGGYMLYCNECYSYVK